MNRKLIRKVAKAHKTTVKDVRESMQAAIDYAHEKPTLQARGISFIGEQPTPQEVIDHAVREVKNNRISWTSNRFGD
jgi:hypothetical protein